MATQSQTTCHYPGCDKERYRSKSGRPTLLCEDHEKEYRKGTLRLRNLKAKVSSVASARKTTAAAKAKAAPRSRTRKAA